jgi:hypothetical protein
VVKCWITEKGEKRIIYEGVDGYVVNCGALD